MGSFIQCVMGKLNIRVLCFMHWVGGGRGEDGGVYTRTCVCLLYNINSMLY